MLDEKTRALVKSTAPVLQENGVALTSHFYKRMLTHNPELREFFNQGHQRAGTQQQALAAAVAAYAKHIDNPSVLISALELMAAKHASLNVRQEHYSIVGHHLLASISEVLGEAATPELIDAWAAAYTQLADLLIGMEQQIYNQAVQQPGGWTGWRTFKVQRKQTETAEVTSFELMPADGGPVPSFRPGQFISVRVLVPDLGYKQPRQYSLSNAPGDGFLRITVKKDAAGMVSHLLHEQINEGDVLELSPPVGDFYLHEDRCNPLVLISAGVGVTPMVSMLEHVHRTKTTRPLRFIHAARDASSQVFADHVEQLIGQLPDAQLWVTHELKSEGATAKGHATGFLNLSGLKDTPFLPADGDYYLCGPTKFMDEQRQALIALGIPKTQIHAEAFGTGGLSS